MSSTLIIDFRQKNEPIFRDEFILIGNLHDKNYKLFLENKITIGKMISDYQKIKNASQIFLLFSDDEEETKKLVAI